MAKATRSAAAPRQTPIVSGPLSENASILDAIGDDQETTLETLNKPKEEEPAAQDPVINEPQTFIPTEEALSFIESQNPNRKQAVILKPIASGKFRLGLENTQENYKAFPGTTQRWAPKKVGNLYRTGLDRPELAPTAEERKEKIKELENHFGRPLDNEFYADMSFKIDNNKPLGEKLFLDDPYHLVVYLAMLESDQVANGFHEYQTGKKPFAEWYVEDKEAEAAIKTNERDNKKKAIRLFDTLSESKRRKVATVLGLNVLGLSPSACDTELWDKFVDSKETDGKAQAKIKSFIDLVEKGDSYLNVFDLVKKAVRFNIIRKVNTGDLYYGDQLIGSTEEQVVAKLMSTANSDLRLGIQTKVDAKFNQI